MNDLTVIQAFSGDLEPVNNITGDLMAIDFFLHPLEDSEGNSIVDSDGNLLNDATPGPTNPLDGSLTVTVKMTGELAIIES